MKKYQKYDLKKLLTVLFLGILLSVACQNIEHKESNTSFFNLGYPRAFLFWTHSRLLMQMDPATIEAEMNNYNGVATPSENWQPFLNYKSRHPEKLMYLFTQGHVFSEKQCRFDPIDRSKFYAGHWVYFEGCKVTEDLPADTSYTKIKVADVSRFNVPAKVRENIRLYEDIVLCRLGSDEKPDFSVAEQVRLIAIDSINSSILVQRASYGTNAISGKANQIYAASHAFEGWGWKDGMSWTLNFSKHCPPDQQGYKAADILLHEYDSLFSPGGPLADYDGMEWDVFRTIPTSDCQEGRKMDTNGDGIGDDGYIDGINYYGIGVFNFIEKLRENLPNKLIMGDGGLKPHNQRCFGLLNGIESEWWPRWDDLNCEYWSDGINTHLFWRENSVEPYFSYFVHKIGHADTLVWNSTPYNIHRLVLAAAQFTDAAVTTYLPIPAQKDAMYGIFDEINKGRSNQLNWLGKPMGPAVSLASLSSNLLDKSIDDLLIHFQSEEADIILDSQAIKLSGSVSPQDIQFELQNLPSDGGDLFITFKIKADPMQGYPRDYARLVQVKSSTGSPEVLSTFANYKWFDVGFYLRNVDKSFINLTFQIENHEPVWLKDVQVHAHPDARYRLFENGVVLANPSDQNYTFDLNSIQDHVTWQRIEGVNNQDPLTNNGKNVTDKVTLGPRDGLFLIKLEK